MCWALLIGLALKTEEEKTQPFFAQFLVLCVKKQCFESCETTTVSAAIACLAICISGIVNKASVCDKNIKFVTGQPFFALHWQRVTQNN